MKSTRNRFTRGLFPLVSTILGMSLAVTLRVEHSCSASSGPAENQPSPVSYFYPVF